MKKPFYLICTVITLLNVLPSVVKAQAAAPSKSPCMNNPQARQFDYWVGEWDVYATGTTKLVGHSMVQRISAGCAILENWTATNNQGEGKSINFIDPSNGMWKQTWVGSGGTAQEFTNGEYKDGAMRFNTGTTTPKGKKMLIHFIFYNEGPDKVRQFYESSADGGKTWITGYDFTYIRRKA